MLTIKVYLKEGGDVADMRKDFPVYQGQYQNILLNVFVPTSVLAPNFQEIAGGAVISPYTSGTTVKVAMRTIERNGAFKMSNDYYLRFVKTLVKDGVSYALFERNLPRAFTEYAGQGVNAPTLIINAVNVKYGEIASATANASNTELSVATDLTRIKEMFLAVSQTYTFTYNADMASWTYLTNAVDLSDYGIFVTGTPKDQDIITLYIVANAPSIMSVLTSQTVKIDVLPSALLDKDEAVEPTEWATVNAKISSITGQLNEVIAALAAKQNQDDTRLKTTAKTVVGAINELDMGVSDNAMDINELQTAVAALEQYISAGENYIGTYKAKTLPTDEQLNDFVRQNTTPSRDAKPGDVVIVVQVIGGATDKNFKYYYSASAQKWDSYEIPPIEEAENGSLGIVAGTYAVEGKDYDILVDIVSGEIKNIYVKIPSGHYVALRELINALDSQIEAMTVTGELPVKIAEKAKADDKGNVIDATYQTKTDGASKQYVRDYALPKEFNNVFYFTKDGFAEELTAETAISDGVQSSVIGYVTLAEKSYTLGDVIFQIGKKNAYSNSLWIGATTAEDVTVRVTTSVTQGEDTTVIAITNTPISITTSGVRVDIRDIMGQLGETIITAEKDTVITQKIEVFREVSAANTFTLYSTLTNPSMFYLYTGAVSVTGANVVQETGNSEENVMSQKAVTTELNKRSLTAKSVDFPHGEPTSVTYDTTDGMIVTGTMRVYTADGKSSYYDVDDASVEVPIIAGDNVTMDADATNKKVIIKAAGGGEANPYVNTSEVVDANFTLTSTSTLADLATQILENKTKVVRLLFDSNLKRILGDYTYHNQSVVDTARVLFKVFSSGLAIQDTPSWGVFIDATLHVPATGIKAEGRIMSDAEASYPQWSGWDVFTGKVRFNGLDTALIAENTDSSGYTVKSTIAPSHITVNYDNNVSSFHEDVWVGYNKITYTRIASSSSMPQSFTFLNEGNVKTLFGNQSIYGSGNIDLYRHNIHIAGETADSEVWCNMIVISSKNTVVDSLTDLYTLCNGMGDLLPISGLCLISSVSGKGPAILCRATSSGGIYWIGTDGSSRLYTWSSMPALTITDTVTTV